MHRIATIKENVVNKVKIQVIEVSTLSSSSSSFEYRVKLTPCKNFPTLSQAVSHAAKALGLDCNIIASNAEAEEEEEETDVAEEQSEEVAPQDVGGASAAAAGAEVINWSDNKQELT